MLYTLLPGRKAEGLLEKIKYLKNKSNFPFCIRNQLWFHFGLKEFSVYPHEYKGPGVIIIPGLNLHFIVYFINQGSGWGGGGKPSLLFEAKSKLSQVIKCQQSHWKCYIESQAIG